MYYSSNRQKSYKKYFSQCCKSDNTVLYSSNSQRTSQEVLQSMPQIRKHSVIFLEQAKKCHYKYCSLDYFLPVQGILHCVIRFDSLTEVLLVTFFVCSMNITLCFQIRVIDWSTSCDVFLPVWRILHCVNLIWGIDWSTSCDAFLPVWGISHWVIRFEWLTEVLLVTFLCLVKKY